MPETKITIDKVNRGSIADQLGIEKGDTLLSIDGKRPVDLIDYRFLSAGDELELEVMKESGEIWACDIEKEYDEDLGLSFAEDTFDGIKSCVNKCVFCFVDQMPSDMRDTLYVKDDDYRLSFLHGNFVTLTNLSERDMERILTMRISPLYISVHCTDPGLRQRMLGNKKAGKIMEQLAALAHAGIDMHTQIVLCPGINDGEELDRSIRDLSSLWPQIKSIAVVPVGLTRHRENLHNLRKFNSSEAQALIEKVHSYQEEFLRKYESPFVYLGDEFYVTAQHEIPLSERYGEYPQLENGVGLVRVFYDSFEEEKGLLPKALPGSKRVAIVTGESGQYVLKPVVDRLKQIENLYIELVGVSNEFFGGHATVAGLLTGTDIANALKKHVNFDIIMLPSVMCKRDEPVFLDGKTPGDLEKELGTQVRVIDIDEGAKQLIEAIID